MRHVVILLALTSAACTQFARADQVQDLRILGVKAAPPEILISPILLTGQAPPTQPSVDVSLEVFAFDPRGGRVTTSIDLCKDDPNDEGCIQASAADVLLPKQSGSGDVDTRGSAAGIVPFPSSSFTFDGALLATIAKGAVPSLATPIEPRFSLDVKNEDARPPIVEERAIKRMPLTIDVGDPNTPAALIQPLMNSFGVTLCSAEEEARPPVVGPASCFRRPIANTNPVLLGFVFSRELTSTKLFLDTAPDVGPVSVVKAAPGSTVRIDPVLTAASIENYQGFDLDIQTKKPLLQNRTENIAIEWFATNGDVGRATTAMQNGPVAAVTGQTDGSLGTTWTAPTQPGARDTILVVVEDQRGGVAFGRIEVEY